jgi:signal transduction histidine kinase
MSAVTSEGRASRGSRAGTAIAVCAVLLSVATLLLDIANADSDIPSTAALSAGWLGALTGLAQVVPGALLLQRLPRHPVAWILVASGSFWVVDSFCASWTGYAVFTQPGLPGASATFYVYQRLGAALLLGLPLLLLVFPSGRLPAEPFWRRLSLASIALTALLPAVLAVVPSSVAEEFAGQPLPPELKGLNLDPVSIELPYGVWQVLLTTAYAGVFLSLVVPLLVVVRRYRASDDVGRAQLRWLVWAAVVDLLAIVAGMLSPDPVAGVLLAVAVACTSVAVVVAVTRHRLYDVDRLISATVLYGLLAAAVVAVDVVVFALAGAVLGQRDSALVAIAVVAGLYAPLRGWLGGLVQRARRGSRDNPYAVVSALAEQLEVSSAPEQQLLAVTRAVGEAFRSPYVRIEIERPSGEKQVVEHGHRAGREVVLPVAYRGEHIGQLTLCPGGRSELSEHDQRLLGDVVRQAAAAARASELSAGLQAIREQLVTTREEERRRLRRDLHDSLGPSLGAVTLRIETARNLASSRPAEADRLLEAATADVAAVLADVRRLVHDLRPPALDELGLVRAIEQLARRLESPTLVVTVDGAAMAGADLPAAVEVAAFRIVSEALNNVVRHSGARRCTIRLGVAGGPDGHGDGWNPHRGPGARGGPGGHALEVEVRDDGRGIPADAVAGVGMLSLRERAAELGGSASAECPDGGGTVVRAALPFTGMGATGAVARGGKDVTVDVG